MTNSTSQAEKPGRILIKGARLSYVRLHAPATKQDGQQKYECTIIVPKSREADCKAIRMAAIAAKRAAERPKEETYRDKPIRDGDTENPKPETKGCIYLSARSNDPPRCCDRNNHVLDTPDEIKRELYSGVIADVMVTAYFFKPSEKTKGNRGIAWALDVVRKRADAPRIDGRASIDDLPPLLEDDDDDLLAGFGLKPAKAEPLGGKTIDELDEDLPF